MFHIFIRILGNLFSNPDAVTNIGANVTVPNIAHVVNTTVLPTTTTTPGEDTTVNT